MPNEELPVVCFLEDVPREILADLEARCMNLPMVAAVVTKGATLAISCKPGTNIERVNAFIEQAAIESMQKSMRIAFVPDSGIAKGLVDALDAAGHVLEYKMPGNSMKDFAEACEEMDYTAHDVSNAEQNFEERKKLMTKGSRSKQRRKW